MPKISLSLNKPISASLLNLNPPRGLVLSSNGNKSIITLDDLSVFGQDRDTALSIINSGQSVNDLIPSVLNGIETSTDQLLTATESAEYAAYIAAVRPEFQPCPPELLRWPQADIGRKVTWGLDIAASNLPFTFLQLLDKSQEQFDKISDVCSANFEFVSTPSPDINIFFENVDGPGGTLGFVFQPSTGTSMSACGVCGPVHMDQSEPFSLVDYGNVLLHELGHSIGLAHTSDIGVAPGSNVMDPTYTFGSPEFFWGLSDIEQLVLRYPF